MPEFDVVDVELARTAGSFAMKAHDAVMALHPGAEPPIMRSDLSALVTSRDTHWPPGLTKTAAELVVWARQHEAADAVRGIEIDLARMLFYRFAAPLRWTETPAVREAITAALQEGDAGPARRWFPTLRDLVREGAFQIFEDSILRECFLRLLETDQSVIQLMDTLFRPLGELTVAERDMWEEEVSIEGGKKRWVIEAMHGPLLGLLTSDAIAALLYRNPSLAVSFANICLSAEQAGFNGAIRLGMMAYLVGAAGAETQGRGQEATELTGGFRRLFDIRQRLRASRGYEPDRSLSEHVWKQVHAAADTRSFGDWKACHYSVDRKFAESFASMFGLAGDRPGSSSTSDGPQADKVEAESKRGRGVGAGAVVDLKAGTGTTIELEQGAVYRVLIERPNCADVNAGAIVAFCGWDSDGDAEFEIASPSHNTGQSYCLSPKDDVLTPVGREELVRQWLYFRCPDCRSPVFDDTVQCEKCGEPEPAARAHTSEGFPQRGSAWVLLRAFDDSDGVSNEPGIYVARGVTHDDDFAFGRGDSVEAARKSAEESGFLRELTPRDFFSRGEFLPATSANIEKLKGGSAPSASPPATSQVQLSEPSPESGGRAALVGLAVVAALIIGALAIWINTGGGRGSGSENLPGHTTRSPATSGSTTGANQRPAQPGVVPKQADRGAQSATSAKVFVEVWASAQTRGDFDQYSSSYAQDFVGVKRTHKGDEKHYKRAKWLKDRRKMFHARVEVRRPTVLNSIDGSTEVIFEQYWASRTYADKGWKSLRLRQNSENGWQIVREEMVTSEPWDNRTFELSRSSRHPGPDGRLRTLDDLVGTAGDKRSPQFRRLAEGGVAAAIVAVDSGDSDTTVTIEATKSAKAVCWNKTGRNAPYLETSGRRLGLRGGSNVTWCKKRRGYRKGETFQLKFDPLPPDAASFDLIEGRAGKSGRAGSWNFKNVGTGATTRTSIEHEVFGTSADAEAPWLVLRSRPDFKRGTEVARMPDKTRLRVENGEHGKRGEWRRIRVLSPGASYGKTGFALSRWVRPVATD